MARKKQTLRQQYITEVKKIEKRYIKAVSRGFVDTRGRYSDEFGNFTWKIPKRIGSREIERIKKHTQKAMEEEMLFFHPEYQKFVSGRAGTEYIRSEAAKWGARRRKEKPKKPPKTWIVQEYHSIIDTIPDSRYIRGGTKIDLTGKKDSLHGALNAQESIVEVSGNLTAYRKYLESHKDEFTAAIIGVITISESEGINQSYNEALAIIKGSPLTMEESIEMEDEDELPY